MPKRATKVVLSEKEEEVLIPITKRHRSEHQQVLRARIVLAAAQGNSNAQIARELLKRGVSPRSMTCATRSWLSLPIPIARWPNPSSGRIRGLPNRGAVYASVY